MWKNGGLPHLTKVTNIAGINLNPYSSVNLIFDKKKKKKKEKKAATTVRENDTGVQRWNSTTGEMCLKLVIFPLFWGKKKTHKNHLSIVHVRND